MIGKILLHKDKEENGKPSPQKQECGCPSLQSSLRSNTHAFLTSHKTIVFHGNLLYNYLVSIIMFIWQKLNGKRNLQKVKSPIRVRKKQLENFQIFNNQ